MGNKTGRNDPCPCGSGKKYKKCCIDKIREDFVSKEYPVLINSGQNFSHDKNFKALCGDPLLKAIKSKQKRKNNHYVPIGYQKRFLPEGQKFLHYLNLNPFIDVPDGRRIKGREIYKQGPKSCFYEKDLYTTKFFGIRNEDIETLLFGKIDDNIHDALDGLVSNNPHLLHKYFQYIFEYIDAQKLRTIKGLDWVRSNYFQLTKGELLLEMQYLRMMHCTMWLEGVIEIVSAEDSDIKFIISDHPVTIYNYACSPESEMCQYPNDPPTAWKSSQTIFPLDLNHCLILTNLEYAKSPDESNPVSSRTNPRFLSQTITRWDNIIRERKLTSKDVCALNYIIKKRARKYIAAGKPEWLYPEKIYSQDEWKSLHEILLPPKNKVHKFGGEIYVGGNNSDLSWYQDAFGRRHTSRENENDSVQKYSIIKRNRILNSAILEIFGFNKGKSWDDFRRDITDEKIKELYGVVGSLWNPDTEILSLLSRPKDDELKAFYHGSLDPRIIPLTVVGYSLYVDKVIMYSPFLNPRVMNKKYSPYENPHQYRSDTIKNISIMMELMPLIDLGIVEMIPDPCEFNSDLRMRTYKMAEARMKYRSIEINERDFAYKLMREDTEKTMLNFPPDILKKQFKELSPDATGDEIDEMVDYTQKQKLADPFASLQPMAIGEKGGELYIFRMSGTHEMALYVAQITGSFVYTDSSHCYKEYKLSELKKPGEKNINPWEPLIKALDEYHLIMYTNPDPSFWGHIKEKGYLKDFIDFHKNVLISVRTINNPEEISVKAKEYVDCLKKINLENIFKKIEVDYKKEYGDKSINKMSRKVRLPASYFIPINGISSNTVTQILLTYGVDKFYWRAAPFGVYLDLNKTQPI